MNNHPSYVSLAEAFTMVMERAYAKDSPEGRAMVARHLVKLVQTVPSHPDHGYGLDVRDVRTFCALNLP